MRILSCAFNEFSTFFVKLHDTQRENWIKKDYGKKKKKNQGLSIFSSWGSYEHFILRKTLFSNSVRAITRNGYMISCSPIGSRKTKT